MAEQSIGDRVLFIGGDLKYGSVQKRCREVAEAIGAAWTAPQTGSAWPTGEVPSADLVGRNIFVLVKASVDRRELQNRGHIIWDVLDRAPPREHIDAYLTSTPLASRLLGPYVPTYTIPHHHCNVSGVFACTNRMRGRILWIGSPEWQPDDLTQHNVELHTVGGATTDNAELYRRADLLLNARRFIPESASAYLLHTVLNSGMKAINAIGFGVPSVTEWEPWIDDIASGCTVACAPGKALVAARQLLQDSAQYNRIRENCINVAE